MFENMNPLDRSTAFLEIAILLLIAFVLGYVAAKLPISPLGKKKIINEAKSKIDEEEEYIDPRDIITEPTSIKAVLTRDRKGNAIEPKKTLVEKVKLKPDNKIDNTDS